MCHRLVLLLGLLHTAAPLAVKKPRLVTEKKNSIGDFVFENGVLRRVTNPIEVTMAPTEEMYDIETTTMLDNDKTTDMTSLLLNPPIPKIFEDIEVDRINSTEVILESENNDLLASSTYIATNNLTKGLQVFKEVTTQAAKVEKPPKRNLSSVQLSSYHSHSELVEAMRLLEVSHPEIVTRYKLGASVEGRHIMALKITSPEGKVHRPLLRPMVKYVANMHGDESVGREMVLALAQHLARNYGAEDRITSLLNTTEIHLVPTMNPDGFERVTRGNFRGVDLNMDFPTWQQVGQGQGDLTRGRQPEVVSMMNWIHEEPFVVSVNFQDGSVGTSHPWSDNFTEVWRRSDLFREYPGSRAAGARQRTPDEREFQDLTDLYSYQHKTMSRKESCAAFRAEQSGESREVVSGNMQDFNYLFSNCLEITAKLSCVKKPLNRKLQEEWENNLPALVAFLETGRGTVHGQVTDSSGCATMARIEVVGRARDTVTTERGEYWRVLSPGRFIIKAVSMDFTKQSEEVEITVGALREVRNRTDLRLDQPYGKSVTTTTSTTTTLATTTTTLPEEEGLRLDLIPGVCIVVSFNGVTGCREDTK